MAYDLFHLPQPPYTQVYNSRGTYTWNKPHGITMVSFFVVGGGGGGGLGGVASTTIGVAGGGGGGGGGVAKLIIPAIFIPESLFINVGAGGTSSTAGGSSFIDIANGANVFTTRIITANGGGAGGNANVGTAGIAGVGATATLVSSAIYLNLGMFTAINGGNGGAGSLQTTASAVGNTTTLTGGGSGGAGMDSSVTFGTPGTITGNGTILPSVPPNPRAVTLTGVGGVYSMSPFQSYGGGGAHAGIRVAGTPGGAGGNGVYGSGGGGGGGGRTAAAAAPGGNGGDGFVIITCF